jgi:hypothetical protein
MAATGHPAPFELGAPAYLIALGGWLAAAVLLLVSAPELAGLAISEERPVGAAHAIGLVFFPFAVAAAVWQLLPVMLRNDPPLPRLRWVVLCLLLAGIPLAVAIGAGNGRLGAVSATTLAIGFALLLAELALLIRGAPRGRLLVVSRPALVLAGVNALAAFLLGAVALDGGPEPLGIAYERLLLVHLALAVVGWLTVMILAVGRTLVPMLGAAAAAGPRRAPLAELALVAGLWTFAAGIAWARDWLVALGVLGMAAALLGPARLFVRVAVSGRVGVREGPVAHVVVGLVFLAQAASLAIAAVLGLASERRAAVAGVLLLGVGWAVGVVLGHLGKLVSLSGWGAWPPGPRPKQADLYPRHGWWIEVVLFAAGVQLLAVGVLAHSTPIVRAGGAVLLVSALVALGCGAETVRRVVSGRRQAQVSEVSP